MLKQMRYSTLAAALVIFAACSEDEAPIGGLADEGEVLTVTVVDGGFIPAEANGSRADDTHSVTCSSDGKISTTSHKTTFANGDAIGVFAVDASGNVLSSCTNLKLAYDGSAWTGSLFYSNKAAGYYAYYPYDEAYSTGIATSTDIGNMASSFSPKSDQSTKEYYTASDYMLSAETKVTNKRNLNFTLIHKMTLVEVLLPFSNLLTYNGKPIAVSGVTEGSVTLASSGGTTTGESYCGLSNFSYYYIINPNNASGYTFTAKFRDPDGNLREAVQTISADAVNAGKALTYTLTTPTITTHSNSKLEAIKQSTKISDDLYILTGTSADAQTISCTEPTTVIAYNYTSTNPLQFSGGADVNLVIFGTNSISSEAAAAIEMSGGTLTIEAGDESASLTAVATSDKNEYAGLQLSDSANLIINSGTVTATSSWDGAGIGSGKQGTCGDITINGGTVNATSEEYGAGIGAGHGGHCGNITINGGTVNASSRAGAGVGSGFAGYCGNITITGGEVSASNKLWGAGIGCGWVGSCNDITITGGTVTASGNDKYDIGPYSSSIKVGTVYVDTSCLTDPGNTSIYRNTFR